MKSMAYRMLTAMALVLCHITAVLSTDDAGTLRVATRVVPPLVIQENGDLSGFSIELWRALAAKLNLKTEFQVHPDVKSLLANVHNKRADLGIAAISITSEREQSFDFSQPIMNSGLQIIVRGKAGSDATNPLTGLLRLLFSPIILVWLGIALVLIILPAHVLWFLERKHHQSIIPTQKYFPGIFHALWWAAGTLATQADEMPRSWLARVMATLWMFTSVVFVAYYTAQLTASLTVEQIQGGIAGPGDLPGKQVATTRGSTAARFLNEQHAVITEVERIEQAYNALLEGNVEAVVFDAPVLLSFVEHEGKGRVRLAGATFHREDYGIVYPEGSALRKKVDRALLQLREDGTYNQIYEKWFGGK